MTSSQIFEATAKVMQVYGVRVVEEPLEQIVVGSELANSRLWVDGDPTDETLDGVSAVLVAADRDAELIDVERALGLSSPYFGGTVLLVGGNHGYTYGEDSNEVVIRRAKILGAWDRTRL